MHDDAIHLQYELGRLARLIPHLRVWALPGVAILAMLCVPLDATITSSPWYLIATLFVLFLGRGLFLGLVDIALCSRRSYDVTFEPLGIGYLAGRYRWYVHLDGVLWIRRIHAQNWTIAHTNGTIINVPCDLLPDRYVFHVRSAITNGWSYLNRFTDGPNASKTDG